MVKRIVIDTNFVMLIFQYKIDIIHNIKDITEDNVEIYVLEQTIAELKKLSHRPRGKDGRDARACLTYIYTSLKKKDLNIITKEQLQLLNIKDKYVDDILYELSKKGFIIATHDKELKKRIKNNLIYLYNKQLRFRN